MFESISWQEFFTAIALILCGYYAITVLLLFSSEITNVFKPKPQGASEPAKQNSENASQSSLMGDVRVERSTQQELPREEVTTSEELQINSLEAEEPISTVDLVEESLQNDFSSISVEIQALAEIATQSTREETEILFKTLLSNYPQLIGTSFQQQASKLIYDLCIETTTHQFDHHAINSWWTDAETN